MDKEITLEKAKKVDSLHRQSMGLVDISMATLREAYLLEKDAADMLKDEIGLEPSRSMIHRSAAWLAVNCRMFCAGKRLARQGLAGNPPEEIADELREALKAAEEGGDNSEGSAD